MAYPDDKETWERVETNDIIVKASTNDWEDFLERLQDTIGLDIKGAFGSLQARIVELENKAQGFLHSLSIISANQTRYGSVAQSGSVETENQNVALTNGVIKNMFVKQNKVMAVGSILVFTIKINEVATSLTLTMTSADGIIPKGDTVHEASINQGDRFCVEVQETGGTSPGTYPLTNYQFV